MLTAEEPAKPDAEYACLVTVRVQRASAEEAREDIESGDWISDLSGWSTKITPIFSWLKEGRLYRIKVVSVSPSFRDKPYSLTQSFLPFDVTCWLTGSARNKGAFKRYIDSRFWLANAQVEVVSVSDAYRSTELEFERFGG